MYKKLYIIGNGFDIHHGIPSRYSEFREWLENNDIDVLDNLRKFYNMDDATWWNDFETELGRPSMSEYIDETAFENEPDYGSDDFHDSDYYVAQFEAENDLEGMVTLIKDAFTDWIASFPQPQNANKIRLDKTDAFFINFNYTDTLQKLYNVRNEDILFIHGRVGVSDLVLGHNRSFDELNLDFTPELPSPPSDLKDDELAEWYDDHEDDGEDYIHQLVREAAAEGVAKLRKDTSTIIRNHQTEFDNLSAVEDINIYGWSFSPVDLPYLDRILLEVDINKVNWTISYFSENDKSRAKDYFNARNIDDSKVTFVHLSDLLVVKQTSIDFGIV